MKSKISASRIRAPTATRAASILAVFHDDTLEDVRDVFALVGRLLELVEQFLELHERDRILLVLKQLPDGLLVYAIRFIFEPVDLDDVWRDGDLLVERADGRFDGVRRGGQQFGELAGAG